MALSLGTRNGALMVLFLCFLMVSTSNAESCAFAVMASNSAIKIDGGSCAAPSLTFGHNVSNSSVTCSNVTFTSGSRVVFEGGNLRDSLYNCDFNGAGLDVRGGSSIYLIGQNESKFTPSFSGTGSNITVAHYLDVNVFEPYGYDSIRRFGTQAAGFSYILPTMNGTVNLMNSELSMGAFVNRSFQSVFNKLRSEIPFGAYNITESTIRTNVSNRTYGRIYGSERFALPEYTISESGMKTYNPYEIDYSFLGYDQLVMFTLNITRNTNLTPVYIQPIYPDFNFNIIPDNGSALITIKYIVAVPPQDSGWNFTAHLYRYLPSEFTTSPISRGVGSRSEFYDAFSFPGGAPSAEMNGTRIYFVNRTTNLALGINSSIMVINGTIPGLGRFIEDSTTPTFSLGLGFCAVANDLSYQKMDYLKITKPGTYHMVDLLQPLAEPALPQLVNAACKVGVVIEGNDIAVDCRGGVIKDTEYGVIITNSSGISLRNCRIEGNGILMKSSHSINIMNLIFSPSNESSAFAVNIIDAQGVTLTNITVEKGFVTPFSAYSSAGSPMSLGINAQDISVCDSADLDAVRHAAYVTGSELSCGFHPVTYVLETLGPYGEFGILLAFLISAYAYIFLKERGTKRAAGRKGRR
jgi:hypothetical protein